MRDPLLDAKEAYDYEVREWNAGFTRYRSTKDYLQEAILRKVQLARDLVRSAESDGGTLSYEERLRVEEIIAEVDELKDRLKNVEHNERVAEAWRG